MWSKGRNIKGCHTESVAMKNQNECCELGRQGRGSLSIESSWEGLGRCVLMQCLVTLGLRNKRTWKQHPEGLVIWQPRGGAQGSSIHRRPAGEPRREWWSPARPGHALGPGWVQLHQSVGQRQLWQGRWHVWVELLIFSTLWLPYLFDLRLSDKPFSLVLFYFLALLSRSSLRPSRQDLGFCC